MNEKVATSMKCASKPQHSTQLVYWLSYHTLEYTIVTVISKTEWSRKILQYWWVSNVALNTCFDRFPLNSHSLECKATGHYLLPLVLPSSGSWLCPPYVIGQSIVFLSWFLSFFLLSFFLFFPLLISAAADWMSTITILRHVVWS